MFDPLSKEGQQQQVYFDPPTPKEITANKIRKAFTHKANNMTQATRMRYEQYEEACWLLEL